MENINDIKIKLIQKICESQNYYLLSSLLKNFESKSTNIVAEPESIYESERPMTEEEVDEYFKEESTEEYVVLEQDSFVIGFNKNVNRMDYYHIKILDLLDMEVESFHRRDFERFINNVIDANENFIE